MSNPASRVTDRFAAGTTPEVEVHQEYLKGASQQLVLRYLKAMEMGEAGPRDAFLEIDLRNAPF